MPDETELKTADGLWRNDPATPASAPVHLNPIMASVLVPEFAQKRFDASSVPKQQSALKDSSFLWA